ncbi:MAG: radical SAM protein [Polyangiaceae bacterium]
MRALKVLSDSPGGAESSHPCFDIKARHRHARIHLPVAPRCNAQCNYCNRKESCPNESRPGLASSILRPDAAVAAVGAALTKGIPLSVVGIAGPGDALANPRETFETLSVVHREFPRLALCLSTNGLALKESVERLEAIGVTHLTVTINAVDPEIAASIYRWVKVDGNVYWRSDAGKAAVDAQLEGLAAAVCRGFATKVNSVVVPGINDEHVVQVARSAAEIGADLHNCIPLIPVLGTPFEALSEPTAETLSAVRDACGAYLPQMTHCTRCRADACGMLEAPNNTKGE